MPSIFLRILLALVIAALGSEGATVANILAFQQKLNLAISEASQLQENTKLAEMLNDVDPTDIFLETSPKKIDYMLVELFKLKQAIRSSNITSDSKLIKLKKLSLTRIRYLEDFVAERKSEIQSPISSKLDIQSISDGDILLLRGASSVSPAVARIGEAPSVYSHIGIVHVDRVTGKKYVVESLPRIGVVANPIEALITKRTPRVSVYRSENVEEAKLASDLAFQMANYNGQNKNPFDFDFTMTTEFSLVANSRIVDGKTKYSFDASDIANCRFFCSKLISYIFFEVGNAEQIPQFKSRFRSSIDELKIAVGVNHDLIETFLPGDFEFEKGFDLVFEYRDTAMTLDARIDDLIMDEIYNKIAFEKKSLRSTRFQRLVAALIFSVTAKESTNKLLRSIGIPMSKNISAKLIVTLYNLDRILSTVRKDLYKQQGITGKAIRTLPLAKLKSIIKTEFEISPKIGKFFIDASERKSAICLQFYAGQ